MNLVQLYVPLIVWIGLGIVFGRTLPAIVAEKLGIGLFWVGVPLGIMIFLRQADLSGSVWIAPVVCWVAVCSGAAIAWAWISISQRVSRRSPFLKRSSPPAPSSTQPTQEWSAPSQGSVLNASMFGNTGYLGYPIALSLVGPKYFAWAVFYDTLGSTLAAYGLGVAMSSAFGANPVVDEQSNPIRRTLEAVIKSPALWGFGAGIASRQVPLPPSLESVLRGFAWTVIALSLLLLGMRLSQISVKSNLQRALATLSIKMLIVPFLVATGLSALGITGVPRLILVLQAAMPPAFATLILAEAYHLDRDLTVATLAIGSVMILLTLPLWMGLFAP